MSTETQDTYYETPRILTLAEQILLEILHSQLKIEEASIEALTGSGEPALMKLSYARQGEIKRQIEELTKPVIMKQPRPF